MAYEPELERLERRYQDDPARNFAQLAEAYRKAGRLEDALTLLQGHLVERPNYVSGLVVLGRCLLDQQNDGEARATFERVLGVDGEHIIALRALGEIAERAGDLDVSRQWFTRLLDVDPMNEDAEEALKRLTEAGAAPPPPAEVGEAPVSIASLLLDEPADEPAATPAPPETYPVPRVEDASWGGRPAEFADEEPEPDEAEPGQAAEPEFEHEDSTEHFMPRPSGAHPRDIETIGELEITSQLPEEESPIGAVPDVDETFTFPTGEREVDLGSDDVRDAADQLADEGPGRAPGSQEIGVTPFDDALGWGAGDRISRQISRDDLQEIAKVHEDTVAPVSELPGLDAADIPSDAAALEVRRVEGLEEHDPGLVEPVPGFEATAEGEVTPEEPVAFVEQEPLDFVNQEIVPLVPEELEESDEAMMDLSGEVVDRATAERRASLMGLPLLDGADAAEAEAPLVLEPEPEPVVTETMAELYVRQGLYDEARDVYRQLLGQRPGDAGLQARLADLESTMKPSRSAVQFAAARSGGRSARAMMLAVLGARPGEAVEAEGAVGADEAVKAVEAVYPVDPVHPTPMDRAFSEEQGDSALGAPTHPAEDEVSLSAVFGEAPPPPEPRDEGLSRRTDGTAGASRAPGGFSFDEFFGRPAAAPPASVERPQRDTLSDDEGDEAFRDWLKGLKG
jgi:tetratricopeptide (TPR) repeat protein